MARKSPSKARGRHTGIPRPVRIHNGHPRLRVDARAIAAVVHLLDAHAPAVLRSDRRRLRPLPAGELSLAFLTDPALAALHGRFLGNPSATDVITFGGDPALGQAGEICVSADAAGAYARRHGRNFSEELTLYVVHGWLHLAGHDDLDPRAKRRMRSAEARALALLRTAGAVPRFSLAGH